MDIEDGRLCAGRITASIDVEKVSALSGGEIGHVVLDLDPPPTLDQPRENPVADI
jgi:hypothetical protein